LFKLKDVKNIVESHNGAKYKYLELRALIVNDNGEVSTQKLMALFRSCANNWWNGWQIKYHSKDLHDKSPLYYLENENGEKRGLSDDV
jgi:hypothetical protein